MLQLHLREAKKQAERKKAEREKRKQAELVITLAGDEAVCPKCGRRLKLANCRKVKYNERWYYTIITTIQGFQVCRHFIVEKTMYKTTKYLQGCQEPYYTIHEAVQNWINENGKETIIARPCNQIMNCYDVWDFAKPMEIRSKRNGSLYYTGYKYEIDAKYIYPHRNILPKIKRNGYTGRFHGLPASELFKLLLSDREAEMLIKMVNLICFATNGRETTRSLRCRLLTLSALPTETSTSSRTLQCGLTTCNCWDTSTSTPIMHTMYVPEI